MHSQDNSVMPPAGIGPGECGCPSYEEMFLACSHGFAWQEYVARVIEEHHGCDALEEVELEDGTSHC